MDALGGGGGGRCYRVVAPIGQGGFGTVYRAELLGGGGFSKQVALKMLHAQHKRADDIMRRLRDEARILGMVRHRAIVQVDGLVQLNGHWTIVMEYVSGATLKQCIETTGPLPPAAALEIASELAGALYTAYNTPGPDGRPLRILHRDIKPSNVQIPAGGGPKVLDFGIATADFERREANTTSRGFGSWEYVSPERLDGVDSPAGDVYSIGALLFECLVGAPFGRASGNPVRHHQRIKKGMEQLSATTGGKVPSVVEFVRSLLAYDPEDRPPSRNVESMASEARREVGGESLRDWAERTVPMVVERTGRLPLDRLSGTIVEEGVASGDEEESVADAPSVAAALGLPPEVTGELVRTYTDEQPIPAFVEPPPAEPEPLTLTALATRDLTPEGTVAARAWAIASVVLLVASLLAIGGLTTFALNPPERIVTINRAPSSPSAPARSVLEPVPELGESEIDIPEPSDAEAEPEPSRVASPTAQPAQPTDSPTPVAPSAPRRLTGVVSVGGDHSAVTLVGDQGSYPPGRVPAGVYVVEATFPERGTVVAGRITVEAGRRMRLICNAVFSRCEPR
ncbi:MAG: protein kinase [Proteobacteria bacterium]|nr:protein kinase [Pseudomonadota bacterium]